MKLRLLCAGLLCSLLLICQAVSYAQSQAAMTESKVLAVIDSIDKASRKGNVAGIVAPLAKDVKIKVTLSTVVNPREQTINWNKEQYAFHTRRGLRRRLAYTLERKNTRVKIYDDKKTATITSDLYETLTIQQGMLRSVSSEVVILSLRDGKIVVTSVDSRIRFY